MGTYLVRTPVAGVTGPLGSVMFQDGEARVEGHLTFVDGVPVLDKDTAPVEFHHMVGAGYLIEEVVEKKAAAKKETT